MSSRGRSYATWFRVVGVAPSCGVVVKPSGYGS
jgi:hypothetical protein